MSTSLPSRPGEEMGEIAFHLRVGVVGHRALADATAVRETAGRVLDWLGEMLESPHAAVRLCVVSSLAEGADRVVAHEALARNGASLEVVLPMPRDEYVEDFGTDASRREFDELLHLAVAVTELVGSRDRDEAYERAGREVIARSDVLVAVWDGKDTGLRAGTAPMVAIAREEHVPLCLVDPASPGEWIYEAGRGLPVLELQDLGAFNGLTIGPDEYSVRREERIAALRRASGSEGHTDEALSQLLDWHVPKFVRADLLAVRYQRLHARLGDALFFLAACALITVGFQLLFFPHAPGLAWLEVGFLAALLLLLVLGRKMKVHDRWIAYRLLAERIRASLFVASVGADARGVSSSERFYPVQPSERWVRRAFEQVWRDRPVTNGLEWDTRETGQFIIRGWIDEQVAYFLASGRRHDRRVRRLEIASVGLFALTMLFAAIHALGFGETESGSAWWTETIALLTIALPAVGVALSGIRTQRDHLRNSLRFLGMQRHLEIAKRGLERTTDLKGLREVVLDMDAAMMDENRDWFLSILIQGRQGLEA